jgi:hypothetical protein
MSAADTFAYLDARPERPGDEVLADRFRWMAAKVEANLSEVRRERIDPFFH